jgi:SOS-response transcriptional repressor LexA
MASLPRTDFPGYRAEQVLMFLLKHYAETGRVATYDEIKAATGIRTDGEVSRIVKSLRRRVGLAGRRNKPRDIAKSQREFPVINGCPV